MNAMHWREVFLASLLLVNSSCGLGTFVLGVTSVSGAVVEREIPAPRPEPLLGMHLRGGLSSYIISSHYWTGWARYLETVPVTRFLRGIGSWTAGQWLRKPEDVERILVKLHEYGIHLFRYEIGWGKTLYREDLSEPLRLLPRIEEIYRRALRASKRHGFELLILLNAHHGMPCAARGTRAVLLEDAPKGATSVLLRIENPQIVRTDYTGISNLSGYQAAEALFKEITPLKGREKNSFRIRLSKPLPKALKKGESVLVHTLQYRPFGDPETDEQTYAGWQEYAELLARIAKEEGIPDGKVHFEIWNELTFGTFFLGIGKYEAGKKGTADLDRLLELATQSIRKHFPQRTMVINGFSNTSFFFKGFWAKRRAKGLNGESYHPYGNRWREMPEFALQGRPFLREAYRNVDGWLPRYGFLFPEYQGNFVTSHNIITLMQPEMRRLLVELGRAPEGWIRGMSEQGFFIPEIKPPPKFQRKLRQNPEHYIAKFWLRLYPFYLNKGLHFVCDGSLRNPSWKPTESWEALFVKTGDERYLRALIPLRRLVELLKSLGPTEIPQGRLLRVRPRVWQLSGQERVIFGTEGAVILQKGAGGRPFDPSKVQPRPLYYRDVFCLLPFQVDEDTLTLAVYIQTRNLMEDVNDAGRYRLSFPEFRGHPQVRLFDPMSGAEVEFQRADDPLTITLTLRDYPLWLILDRIDGPRGDPLIIAPPVESWLVK